MADWTQVSRLGTGSFIPKGTQKPTEGTVKGAKSNYFRRNQMAQVTYRGVSYDTEEYNAKVLADAAKRQRHDLMYRGLKVTKKVAGGV